MQWQLKLTGFYYLHFSDNGIPQGSPLFVVLYAIYSNSLARALESSSEFDHFGIYADSIFITASGQPKAVEENLNLLDRRIHQWVKSKGAVIPPEKIELVHVCRYRNCNNNTSTLCIRGINAILLDEMKILGIIFSRNLSWNRHVKYLTNNLVKTNNLLKLICSRKKGPHMETALNICWSHVMGGLQHEVTLYGWT